MWGLTAEDLLGRPTLHVPMNLIVQDVDGDKVTGVFQSSGGSAMKWESDATHQLINGDVFIRPQLVCETNAMRGWGLSNIACNGFVADVWKRPEGKCIFMRK